MKKTNTAFNIGTFTATLIGFMIFINILFFIQGTFFTDGGYVFDADKFIFEQLPIAFICGIGAGFVNKREREA